MKPIIQKIVIENFKSFGEKEVFDKLENFVVLTGAKNRGKSNTLDAIAFVLGAKLTELSCRGKDILFKHSDDTIARVAVAVVINSQTTIEFMRTITDTHVNNYYINNQEVPEDIYIEKLELNKLSFKNCCYIKQHQLTELINMSKFEITHLFETLSGSIAYKEEYEKLKEEYNSLETKKEKIRYRLLDKKFMYSYSKGKNGNIQEYRETLDSINKDYVLCGLYKLYRTIENCKKTIQKAHDAKENLKEQFKCKSEELKKAFIHNDRNSARTEQLEEEILNLKLDLIQINEKKIEVKVYDEEILNLNKQRNQMKIKTQKLLQEQENLDLSEPNFKPEGFNQYVDLMEEFCYNYGNLIQTEMNLNNTVADTVNLITIYEDFKIRVEKHLQTLEDIREKGVADGEQFKELINEWTDCKDEYLKCNDKIQSNIELFSHTNKFANNEAISKIKLDAINLLRDKFGTNILNFFSNLIEVDEKSNHYEEISNLLVPFSTGIICNNLLTKLRATTYLIDNDLPTMLILPVHGLILDEKLSKEINIKSHLKAINTGKYDLKQLVNFISKGKHVCESDDNIEETFDNCDCETIKTIDGLIIYKNILTNVYENTLPDIYYSYTLDKIISLALEIKNDLLIKRQLQLENDRIINIIDENWSLNYYNQNNFRMEYQKNKQGLNQLLNEINTIIKTYKNGIKKELFDLREISSKVIEIKIGSFENFCDKFGVSSILEYEKNVEREKERYKDEIMKDVSLTNEIETITSKIEKITCKIKKLKEMHSAASSELSQEDTEELEVELENKLQELAELENNDEIYLKLEQEVNTLRDKIRKLKRKITYCKSEIITAFMERHDLYLHAKMYKIELPFAHGDINQLSPDDTFDIDSTENDTDNEFTDSSENDFDCSNNFIDDEIIIDFSEFETNYGNDVDYDEILVELKKERHKIQNKINTLSDYCADYEDELDYLSKKLDKYKAKFEKVEERFEAVKNKRKITLLSFFKDIKQNFIDICELHFQGRMSVVFDIINNEEPYLDGITYQTIGNNQNELILIPFFLMFTISMSKESHLFLFDDFMYGLPTQESKKIAKFLNDCSLNKNSQIICVSSDFNIITNSSRQFSLYLKGRRYIDGKPEAVETRANPLIMSIENSPSITDLFAEIGSAHQYLKVEDYNFFA